MGQALGIVVRVTAVAVAATAFVSAACAQERVVLPPIDVASSRLDSGVGIAGTSTTVITAEDIARSPGQSITDIIGEVAGVQVTHTLGNPIGVNDVVDIRGFGVFAQSNVLVLVNGRRYQDFDSQGFDFASIPLNSIQRIEVTKGNSGAVLYGDGAVGGVINIVTKSAAPLPYKAKIESAAGSYGFLEGRLSTGASSGPWSLSVFSNVATDSGYRQNSKSRQNNLVSNLNYAGSGWSAYLTLGLDQQRQNLPGALPNLPLVFPITLDDPRASVLPLDWANKQDVNVTGGATVNLAPNVDLIVDGGVRRKFQQSEFFNYFNNPFFVYDPNSAAPSSYINTGMTTSSLTPRLDAGYHLLGVKNHLLTGLDLYNTQYDSDRYSAPINVQAIHHYNIRQTTAALYAMDTAYLRPDLDLSFGARLQRNMLAATDDYNAADDPNAGFYATSPQAPSLSTAEWQYAAHLGLEYRLNQAFTLFARGARAFRLPNADERVGAGNPFGFVAPANFDLKTQTSYDIEGGFRFNWNRLHYETSVYRMELENEIHFIPALFLDVNLEPTERTGWENFVTYQLTEDVRLRSGLAYTRAIFREGPNAGNDVPMVSRWSGTAGVSWNIWKEWAVLDVSARFLGERRMDNDQANVQPLIPAVTTVDAKLGGKYDRFFWSIGVQNLFNVNYYDYAIASAAY